MIELVLVIWLAIMGISIVLILLMALIHALSDAMPDTETWEDAKKRFYGTKKFY